MSLYFKYFLINIKKELQYKTSFILSFISQFFVFFGYYFTIICLFEKFSNIRGFTKFEVLLTFSIIQFGFSFCETFFRGIDKFDDLIIKGDFDKLLLRPRGILYQVFCEDMSLIRASRLIQAIIVFIIAVINIDINWNIYKVVTVTFMMISSVILFLSIFIMSAAYCFITIKGLEVRNLFTDGGKHMAQYPIGIFKKGFILFFTYIIPFGFVNYYPLLYLLGKNNNNFFIFSPLITVIWLIISIIVFNFGAKKYTSVGS